MTQNDLASTNSEKRERLVQEIRNNKNDSNIKHIIVDLKKDDIKDIKSFYFEYCLSSEDKNALRISDTLRLISELDFDIMERYEDFDSDFESYKQKALKRIGLYETMLSPSNEKESYNEIEEYLDEKDIQHLTALEGRFRNRRS